MFVKMTSVGPLAHRCPPSSSSCCCWDIDLLSSTAPPLPPLLPVLAARSWVRTSDFHLHRHDAPLWSTCRFQFMTQVPECFIIWTSAVWFGLDFSHAAHKRCQLNINDVPLRLVTTSLQFDNEQSAPHFLVIKKSKDTQYCSKDQGLWLNSTLRVFYFWFLHYLITITSQTGVRGVWSEQVTWLESATAVLSLD